MTPAEDRATTNLRESAKRRSVAVSVKRRVSGDWIGVAFSLLGSTAGDSPLTTPSVVVDSTRLAVVLELTRLVLEQVPMRRGPRPKA